MNWHAPLLAPLLVGAAWLTSSSVAGHQDRSGQAPVFRSGVELVVVDVGVVDKQGHPVRGLVPADFVVTVDGQPRRVVTAEYVDVAAEIDLRTEVAAVSTNEGAGVGRQFVFVVDTSTLEAGDARRVTGAASRLFSRLSFADRTALYSLPLGRSMMFTWRHDRVIDALQQTVVGGYTSTTWEYGSLTEARDIATRRELTLRDVAERSCATARVQTPAPPAGGNPAEPGQGTPPGGSAPASADPALGGRDQCMREIQANAQMTWNMVRANSLSSVSALRQLFSTLRNVSGDKTVVLISGGWPLDDNEQTSLLNSVADDAAAARATLLTVFVPRSTISASRRSMSHTPLSDRDLHLWPLETLASMTGGESFRADAAPEATFERMGRALAGYYRIGVERNATDLNAGARRMKVQVSGGDVSVRARGYFDATRFEDRNWSARLASALGSPVPATAVPLRVTNYIGADPDDPAYVRIVLAGEASRLQPGEAVMQLVVRDMDGRNIVTGDQRLGKLDGGTALFATNVRVTPGSYVVRLAVMDGAGRVGSVDHRVEARPVSLGSIAVTGPILVNAPTDDINALYFDVNGIKPGERLALEVGLAGGVAPDGVGVVFEVASSPSGPALVQEAARVLTGHGRAAPVLAQAVADVRALPPGEYFVRVNLRSGDQPLGQLHRGFSILEAVLR
jgi:VWFA-related protein